jgi:hypothetical protein
MSVQGPDTLARLWDFRRVAEGTQRLSMRRDMDGQLLRAFGRRRQDKDAVVSDAPRFRRVRILVLGCSRGRGTAETRWFGDGVDGSRGSATPKQPRKTCATQVEEPQVLLRSWDLHKVASSRLWCLHIVLPAIISQIRELVV